MGRHREYDEEKVLYQGAVFFGAQLDVDADLGQFAL